MTRGERIVLEETVGAAQRGHPLPKTYFDSFPHKRKIAKDLMWRGYLESAGPFGNLLNATPAGYDAVKPKPE